MSPMPSFANHTITIVEPGTRTVHGSTVDDWTPGKTTERTIARCLVQPATTEESGKDPDTVRDSWTIHIPGHASPPTSQAKIRHPFSAGPYQVIGEPMPQPDTRGGIDHWFVACERWKTSV